MVSSSRWLLLTHATLWVGKTLEIFVETDAPCHLTMLYQQSGIKIHDRITMKRGVPLFRDPHLAFDNYQTQEQTEAGDTPGHHFSIVYPYICKTYYWKFIGTVDGIDSPSHSPVFALHLEKEEIPPIMEKEIYFPVIYGSNGISGSWTPSAPLRASSEYATMPLSIPFDFNTLISAHIIVIPLCSGAAVNWDINAAHIAKGESYMDGRESDVTTTYDTRDYFYRVMHIPCEQILTDLSPGDVGGVWLQQQHSEEEVNVMGLRLKYE